jgi:hypothetical protein
MQKLTRPGTLEQGKLYLHSVYKSDDNGGNVSLIRFSSYTACPAIVIIIDRKGKKIRCARDDLFELKDTPLPFRMSMLIKFNFQTLEVYDVLHPVINFFVALIKPDKPQYHFSPDHQEISP